MHGQDTFVLKGRAYFVHRTSGGVLDVTPADLQTMAVHLLPVEEQIGIAKYGRIAIFEECKNSHITAFQNVRLEETVFDACNACFREFKTPEPRYCAGSESVCQACHNSIKKPRVQNHMCMEPEQFYCCIWSCHSLVAPTVGVRDGRLVVCDTCPVPSYFDEVLGANLVFGGAFPPRDDVRLVMGSWHDWLVVRRTQDDLCDGFAHVFPNVEYSLSVCANTSNALFGRLLAMAFDARRQCNVCVLPEGVDMTGLLRKYNDAGGIVHSAFGTWMCEHLHIDVMFA